jgi:hypothetical protein
MVSIILNNLLYKPFLKDIMDKYYEKFCGQNQSQKQNLFNSIKIPDHSDQDSDTDGWTRLSK